MEFSLAEYLLKGLVSQPEAVSLMFDTHNDRRVLRVRVASRDVAKVMGSRGLVIRAIRTVLSMKHHDFEEILVEGIEA